MRKSLLAATAGQPLCRGGYLRELRTQQQEAGEASALSLDAHGTRIELPSLGSPKPSTKHHIAPARAAWLFVSQPTKLDEKQRRHVQAIRAGQPDLETAYDLSQRFVVMLAERRGGELNGSGVGVQGNQYEVNSTNNEEFNSQVAQTITITDNEEVIAEGPAPNFLFKDDFHLTVNPDGTVTSFHDNFRFVCQG